MRGLNTKETLDTDVWPIYQVMKLPRVLNFIGPKSSIFFDLFTEDTKNLVDQAKTFHQIFSVENKTSQEEIIKKVKAYEHRGDEITHQIFLELSSNFITPFDREDMHALATSLDDIADYIHGTSSRISLYGVKEFSKSMELISEILLKQVEEIHTAIGELKNMRNAERVRTAIVQINFLENEADDLFDEAITRLFADEIPAIEIIKIKEVLSNLETATDKCEDVANTLETILVKNS
jgi:predicted phosphate transport protein (TIGR00153 family)